MYIGLKHFQLCEVTIFGVTGDNDSMQNVTLWKAEASLEDILISCF